MTDSEHSNNNGKDAREEHKPWYRRALRFVWVSLFTLLVILILLILFVRSPWGQNIITQKVTEYVSNQTKTEVSIQKLYVTFTGDITVKGVYLEDQQGDTLFYSQKLKADIPLWPIIQGQSISIRHVTWKGLRLNVTRKDSLQGFNYQFLIDAFASDTTQQQPDTSSSALPAITIGQIDFTDFRIHYADAVSGTNAQLNLDHFRLNQARLNLQKMKFHIGNIALKNTAITYRQTKPLPAQPEETGSTLPKVQLDNLTLNNVTVRYRSTVDGIKAYAHVNHFLLQLPEANMVTQTIRLNKIALRKSTFRVQLDTLQQAVSTPATPSTSTQQSSFTWPDWKVYIASIHLKDNQIRYQAGAPAREQRGFNPNSINLKHLSFKVDEFKLMPNKQLNVQLNNFSFSEASGFELNQFQFGLSLTNETLQIDHLKVKTGNSLIAAHAKTQYASLKTLINHPKRTRFNVVVNQFAIDLSDFIALQPDLKSTPYVKQLSRHSFTGQIKATGSLAHLQLPTFIVKWGANTRFAVKGSFKNIAQPEQLQFAVKHIDFKTKQRAITSIITADSLSTMIPKQIQLTGQLHGSLDHLQAHAQLQTSNGGLTFDGQFSQKQQLAYQANVSVHQLELGTLLQNPAIGPMTFTLTSSGQGSSIDDLTAKLKADFSTLAYNNYDFSALKLSGSINQGEGNINIRYDDKNMDLAVNTDLSLDSTAQRVKVAVDLNGANLYALGLMIRKMKAGLKMTTTVKNAQGDLSVKGHLAHGTVVYQQESYPLGEATFSALIKDDTTAVEMNSSFFDTKLYSNTGITQLSTALGYQFKRYFNDSLSIAPIEGEPVYLTMDMTVAPNALISQVFMPDLKSMDTLHVAMNFNQSKHLLTATMNLPHLNYASNTIDSLQLDLRATENAGHFKVGFSQLNAGAFMMNRTFWKGRLEDDKLTMNFNAFNAEGRPIYATRLHVSSPGKPLVIHLSPDRLLLNGKQWSIPTDNKLLIKKNKIVAQHFVLSRNHHQLKIANDLADTQKNNIGIGFNNLHIATFLGLFNPESYIASGQLQGHIVAVNPMQQPGLIADMAIDSLEVLQVPLGHLSLQAQNSQSNQYDFTLRLKGPEVNVNLDGQYVVNQTTTLDLTLALKKFGMKPITKFSNEYLAKGSGYLSGDVTVQGPLADLKYKGSIRFNDASFKVNPLNTSFQLANDEIDITNEGITLQQFSIEDQNGHLFTVDGFIATENMLDPTFDLTLDAQQFQLMHSTQKNNEIYYGTVNLDLHGTITGPMSFPVVDLQIGVNENTNFTYVMSETQAALQKQEGIVTFVNKSQPENILTSSDDLTQTAQFTGMQLHANIDIAQGATFGVIIDPRTGDNFRISGEGALDFRIKRNGQITLTGRYVIGGGHYQMTLYHLVKRKFEFKPGSTILWQGSPLDAVLDVTAIYSVKTSAYDLMATQISGLGSAEQSKYRQRLPFLVSLHVEGTIDRPELSFGLGMPEKAQGALGGAVYGRINQLNQNVGALNKQVFSLLVFNRFYPAAGSDGSEGGVATIARNNLNRMLSNQLNAFSDRLLSDTGLQLNFGLESYQGAKGQTDTDLNISAQKTFFNDRLIIKAGTEVNVQGGSRPGEENPLLGNASIEYLLTEDGRWRIRLFRKNTYENVIDGQVVVNGIGVLFQHQFNEFYELWESLFGNPQPDESTQ